MKSLRICKNSIPAYNYFFRWFAVSREPYTHTHNLPLHTLMGPIAITFVLPELYIQRCWEKLYSLLSVSTLSLYPNPGHHQAPCGPLQSLYMFLFRAYPPCASLFVLYLPWLHSLSFPASCSLHFPDAPISCLLTGISQGGGTTGSQMRVKRKSQCVCVPPLHLVQQL